MSVPLGASVALVSSVSNPEEGGGVQVWALGSQQFEHTGQYAWRVFVEALQGTNWVMLGRKSFGHHLPLNTVPGVSEKKHFPQNAYQDPSVFGWSSANQVIPGLCSLEPV